MSEQTRYAVCDAALEELMLEAAEGMEAGLSQLTIILKMAQPRENEQWPAEVRKFWAENLEMVVERISPTNFRSCDGMFLESVLVAGFDSLLFRDRLVAYFKHVFHHYRDPAGMLETLGVRDRSLPLSTVLLRYQMLQQVKPGAYCYDRQAGLGTILQLDDIANELSIQFDRRLTIPLERFLSYFIIVKDLSFLHGLISNKSPRQVKMATLTEDILGSLLTMLPLEEELVPRILVPKIFSKDQYRKLTTESDAAAAAPSALAEQPEAAVSEDELTGADAESNVELERWDSSRSMLELSERLKNLTSLELPDPPDSVNIDRIMHFSAGQGNQAELFAQAMALLGKLAGEQMPWLEERLTGVAEQAVVWQDPEVFASVTDKLTARMLPFWLRVTAIARGNDFLAAQALHLPARLWPHVEKALAEFSAANLLLDKVTEYLKTGKLSADLLFWIWRGDHQELKDTYLGDAPLLFKTLSLSLKGSYLKAQRDLRRLLLNDEKFQRQVMLQGQREAVLALIRSARHMPLLDSSERQSLLVKIVRLYPEYISDVEERHTVTPRRAVKKMTSERSYQQRRQEMEELINELIPANIKAIEEARAHGDLRENSEYKYAKEQQVFLASRSAELEESLTDLLVTDFRDVVVDKIAIPGSQIIIELPNGSRKTYFLLGLFDSNSELGMISYDAPIGKLLLGCEPGDELELPSGEKAKVITVSALPEKILAQLSVSG